MAHAGRAVGGIEQDLTDHRQDNGHLTGQNRDNNSPLLRPIKKLRAVYYPKVSTNKSSVLKFFCYAKDLKSMILKASCRCV